MGLKDGKMTEDLSAPTRQVLLQLALDSMDAQPVVTRQILEMMLVAGSPAGVDRLQEQIGNQQMGDSEPANGNGSREHELPEMTVALQKQINRRGITVGQTFKVYAVEKANVTRDGAKSLSPAQQKLLTVLLRAPKPLDVWELTELCGVEKKTVTNGLSALKRRQMVRVIRR